MASESSPLIEDDSLVIPVITMTNRPTPTAMIPSMSQSGTRHARDAVAMHPRDERGGHGRDDGGRD